VPSPSRDSLGDGKETLLGNASGREGMRYPRGVLRKSRFAPISSVRSNSTPKARMSQASFNNGTDDPGSPYGCSQPSSPPLCGGVMTRCGSCPGEEESSMKVVLFCGGLGMRLRDYSDTIPKPMINIGY